jgi:putative flippase GtrA
MWVLVDLFFFNYLFAKLISIGGVTVWNFVSKKKLVFTR